MLFNITPAQLQSALFVISAVLAAIITIDKIVDIIKKYRQPAADIQEKLAADKTRLEIHEQQIMDLTNIVTALCKAEVAHLTYEITGQDKDKIQDALTTLTNTTLELRR